MRAWTRTGQLQQDLPEVKAASRQGPVAASWPLACLVEQSAAVRGAFSR